MLGTLITAGTTITVVALNNSEDVSSNNSSQNPQPTGEIVMLTEAKPETEFELDATYEAIEQTLADMNIEQHPGIESATIDSEIQLTNGQTIHIEQTQTIVTEVDDTTFSGDVVTIKWNDSDEDFERKIEFLRSRGLRVLANRFDVKDKHHMKLNIFDSTGRGSDIININLNGEYEIELGWKDVDGTMDFYYSTTSRGSVNAISNRSMNGAETKSRSVTTITATSVDDEGNTSTSTISTGSSTITTTTVTVDGNGNTVKEKKKEVNLNKEKEEE